jgi:hypothetical protein
MQSHVPQSPLSPDSSATSAKKKRVNSKAASAVEAASTRCRPKCDPAIGRCPRHRFTPIDVTDDIDLSHFTGKLEGFRSATQIDDFLTVLIRLVITNEISARRAAVISYLTSQLPVPAATPTPPTPLSPPRTPTSASPTPTSRPLPPPSH